MFAIILFVMFVAEDLTVFGFVKEEYEKTLRTSDNARTFLCYVLSTKLSSYSLLVSITCTPVTGGIIMNRDSSCCGVCNFHVLVRKCISEA